MQSSESDQRFHDFIAELDQCCFGIFLFSETWRAGNSEGNCISAVVMVKAGIKVLGVPFINVCFQKSFHFPSTHFPTESANCNSAGARHN